MVENILLKYRIVKWSKILKNIGTRVYPIRGSTNVTLCNISLRVLGLSKLSSLSFRSLFDYCTLPW